ncbi:MAG: tetratricopeptide repeat protein, partial [Planctomycetes bacterium]|nr:tetratricopeptide repeat protein [Planctomycetota bacterium]
MKGLTVHSRYFSLTAALFAALFLLVGPSLAQDSDSAESKPDVKSAEAAAQEKAENEVDDAIAAAERLESMNLAAAAVSRLESELLRNSFSTKLIKEVAHRRLRGEVFDPRRALELYTMAWNRDAKDLDSIIGVSESAAALAASLRAWGKHFGNEEFRNAVEVAQEFANKAIEVSGDSSARAHVILGEQHRRGAIEMVFSPKPDDPNLAEQRKKFIEDRNALLALAVSHYEKALALEADDPISERALVDTYIELGNFSKAKQALEKIRIREALQEKDEYSGFIVYELEVKLAKAQNPVDCKALAKAWAGLAKISDSFANRLSASLGGFLENCESPEFAHELLGVWQRYFEVERESKEVIKLLAPFSPRTSMSKEDEARVVPTFAFLCASAWEEEARKLNVATQASEQEQLFQRALRI